MSFGVADYEHSDTAEQWVQKADMALYRAKTTGKNKVILFKGVSL
jgi:PleD family two-component response regulator